MCSRIGCLNGICTILRYICFRASHIFYSGTILFVHLQRLVSKFNIISSSIKQKCFQSRERLQAPKNTVLNLTWQTLSDAPPLFCPSNLSVAKWKAHFCVIHLLFHSAGYITSCQAAADTTELDLRAHRLLMTSQPILTGKIYLKSTNVSNAIHHPHIQSTLEVFFFSLVAHDSSIIWTCFCLAL